MKNNGGDGVFHTMTQQDPVRYIIQINYRDLIDF